ncbi:MAG: hypothetical protein MR487_02365 [Lachnospiraceae bacterium]|nr:hypothetical protein [Lachnospiraceae bacterium]
MQTERGIFISDNHTRSDYRNLRLRIDSDSEAWNKAINIFRERIYGRFINQIKLLNKNARQNGFASMAMCCLLIDTMYKFEHGSIATNYNEVKYEEMLMTYMNDVFISLDVARAFYRGIRCGILHSGETQNGCMLSVTCNHIIEVRGNGMNTKINVNVIDFSNRVIQYIDNYIERLYMRDIQTRRKFIKKMNYLCDREAFFND